MAIEVHFQKRSINNRKVVREPDAKNQREYLLVTLLGALFVVVLLFYGWQHYQWIQYGYRIEEAEKIRERLTEMGRQLRVERASLRSVQRIDSVARTQLGMVAPTVDEVDFFPLDSPRTGGNAKQETTDKLTANR
jgi:cell division protein FtsL